MWTKNVFTNEKNRHQRARLVHYMFLRTTNFCFSTFFSKLDYLTDRYSLSDTLKIIHATILRTTILAKIASFAAAAAAVAAVFAAEERKWRQWVCFNNILELPERFWNSACCSLLKVLRGPAVCFGTHCWSCLARSSLEVT